MLPLWGRVWLHPIFQFRDCGEQYPLNFVGFSSFGFFLRGGEVVFVCPTLPEDLHWHSGIWKLLSLNKMFLVIAGHSKLWGCDSTKWCRTIERTINQQHNVPIRLIRFPNVMDKGAVGREGKLWPGSWEGNRSPWASLTLGLWVCSAPQIPALVVLFHPVSLLLQAEFSMDWLQSSC